MPSETNYNVFFPICLHKKPLALFAPISRHNWDWFFWFVDIRNLWFPDTRSHRLISSRHLYTWYLVLRMLGGQRINHHIFLTLLDMKWLSINYHLIKEKIKKKKNPYISALEFEYLLYRYLYTERSS